VVCAFFSRNPGAGDLLFTRKDLEALIAARKDFGIDYAKEQLVIDTWPNWAESKD
jgi:hypothetical protein